MKPHMLEDDDDIKVGKFYGGLTLVGHKSISTQVPIRTLEAPDLLTIPVNQQIGEAGEIVVRPGQRVLKGETLAVPSQLISAAIHSPVSGTVEEIAMRRVAHPSGLDALCIIIRNDHRYEWVERAPVGDDFYNISPHDLRGMIRDAGIVGLGGANFPTAVKTTEIDVRMLIINGVECEPYISCDDMQMRERAAEIVCGAEIIGHIVKAREIVFAIEDNKPEAIAAMTAVVEQDETGYLRIEVVPTKYPSGGEKQLIQVITGREVPKNGLPADIGVLMQNVGTAVAVQRKVYHDEPLISRVVTVTGNGVHEAANYEVPIGTAMADVIAASGGYRDDASQLIMGGPMMGFSLPGDDTPVVKSTNCLLVSSEGELHPADSHQHSPCIRCGYCVDVCPAKLLPQQLYWYASSQNFERLVEHDLFECIECGCCSYVCPSEIPLVQYYRFAKSEIWQQEAERKKSDQARERHEAREARLERARQEREERMRKKREALKKNDDSAASDTGKDSKSDAIAAALARVQAKKQQHAVTPKNTDNLTQEQQALIAAVDKRRNESNPSSQEEL